MNPELAKFRDAYFRLCYATCRALHEGMPRAQVIAAFEGHGKLSESRLVNLRAMRRRVVTESRAAGRAGVGPVETQAMEKEVRAVAESEWGVSIAEAATA